VVRRLSATFDVVLGPLALVTLCLFITELLVRLDSPWNTIVYGGQVAIWAVFLLAFVVELRLAPKKIQYLKRNWLLIVALVIPALRIFRAAQAIRVLRSAQAVRGTTVVRSYTSLYRATNVIRGFFSFSHTAFLGILAVIVWALSSGLVYYLEKGREGEINSLGDALWWAASILTTIGPNLEPVTLEGRIVSIAVRLFGIAIFGYLTARLAAYFLGGQADEPVGKQTDELREVRRELGAFQAEIRARFGAAEGP
jgi:voltage-gated potassium channel